MAENKTAKPKSMTKSALFQKLAEEANLTRKDVAAVFDALTALIKGELGKKGPGVLTLPGLVKLRRAHKPATKARPGRNPATGEPMTIKAKPARTVVSARPLKNLKEMVK